MIYNILKTNFLFLIIFISSNNFSSQVKVEWQLDTEMKNAYITLYNNSTENIIIPIDKSSLQVYSNDNCYLSQDNWDKSYPSLGLVLNIYESDSQNRAEIDSGFPYLDLENFDELKKKKDSIETIYSQKVDRWKQKNKIQKDNFAQINYYLVNNLIALKPKEKIKISLPFTLRNVTNQKYDQHDSYILMKNKQYYAYLSICIDENNYRYFTSKQKRKLKKYKLFTGKLESNKITLQ